MSVKIEPSGRRSVFVEKEVPGTPEEVWAAIATGPGVSSWFVPTVVDERVGGKIVCSFGPGMDAAATIKEWEAPQRFLAESDPTGAPGPSFASEWTVEAKGGGKCVVRVVNSLFADGDDWDDQLTGLESGWPGFFRILDLYLRYFKGQPSSMFLALQGVPGEEEIVWAKLVAAIGLAAASPGEERRSPPGVPAFAGTVEASGEGKVKNFALLRLEEPCPGIGSFGAYQMGGVQLGVTYYLYGEAAAELAKQSEAAWRQWLADFAATVRE